MTDVDYQVDRLQTIFKERFHYTTDIFEIPSERSETGLHKKIADFAHEYNEPNNLMILYYAGHAYTGLETQALKLAALARTPSSLLCLLF